MSFAIIKTGGKQYKVSEGDVLKIEKLADKNAGDTVTFEEVLLVDDGSSTSVGAPLVKGANVSATIKSVLKQKKVFTMKYKPKSNKTGKIKNHRQTLATIKIDKITK
jgi:large subunit ribosomal protein L21